MLLFAKDAQSACAGFAHGLVDAVGLQQAAVADADFLGDVAVPPVGGEAVATVFLRGGIDGDVIRAFELDDVGCHAIGGCVAPAFGVLLERQSEFGAGVTECLLVVFVDGTLLWIQLTKIRMSHYSSPLRLTKGV